MKKKMAKYFALVILVVLSIFTFSFLRFRVDQTSFLVAFDKVLVTTISSIWGLITTPTIFISILVVLMLLKYQFAILAIIPGLKEIKAGPVSALFGDSVFPEDKALEGLSSLTKENNDSTSLKDINILADSKSTLEMLSKTIGKNSAKYLLDLDGKILTVRQAVEMFKQNFIEAKIYKDEEEEYSYYLGYHAAFMKYIGYSFILQKTSEDKKTAYFSLEPYKKEILTARINTPEVQETISKRKLVSEN